MKPAVVVLAVLLAGCSRYSDFTLPRLAGGNTGLTWRFEEASGPVLSPAGGWESSDVLNPSITTAWARGIAPLQLILYSGFDGVTWRTGVYTNDSQRKGVVLSPDPQTWEGSYIAANGTAMFFQRDFWYWYVAGPRERPAIGLARASQSDFDKAAAWRKEAAPVLRSGPYMSWDEYGVADPYVIRIEPYFYLYYLGEDRGYRQKIGVARSKDGLHWEKLRTNPVLEADENLGEPAVWQSNGFYWMLYTVRNADETRHLRLARSTDGVSWTVLPAVIRGTRDWDSKVICDPTVVEATDDEVSILFGGGDVAGPDENIHGQIGKGKLLAVHDTLGK